MTDAVKERPCVLIVDSPYGTFQCLKRRINAAQFDSMRISNDRDGLNFLKRHADKNWIVIADLNSHAMGGGGFIHQARDISRGTAFLMVGPLTAFLYQAGRFYAFSQDRLKQDINRVLTCVALKMGMHGIREANKKNRPVLPKRKCFGRIIGESTGMNRIYQMIDNLKTSCATVLIQGESGTGKELVARTIHETGPDKGGPWVAVNCGAIPVHLMESILFGHEKGAFTNAVTQRKGTFETVRNGTLFLDEIGELDRDVQVKLLRVLQEKEFQRVGGSRMLRSNARIIAATNLDLGEETKAGRFREDLFYRLNVVPLKIPPLRERKEDIPPLLDHFLKKVFLSMNRKVPFFTANARHDLVSYAYPGNVREMENIVERLCVSCPDRPITREELPEEIQGETVSSDGSANMIRDLPDEGVRLDDLEKELIFKTLEKTRGNKKKAADVLGITRRLLYLRLARYGKTSDTQVGGHPA